MTDLNHELPAIGFLAGVSAEHRAFLATHGRFLHPRHGEELIHQDSRNGLDLAGGGSIGDSPESASMEHRQLGECAKSHQFSAPTGRKITAQGIALGTGSPSPIQALKGRHRMVTAAAPAGRI